MDHEQGFVDSFVAPERRARYENFLRKPNRRARFINRFCHHFDLVEKRATQIQRTTASQFAAWLRDQGAGELAHIIGSRDEINGRDLPLEQAITEALADPGGVVVFPVVSHFIYRTFRLETASF